MYPVNIELSGRPCLVIGGGHVALRKIKALLEENAAVTAVAPEACREIRDLADGNHISWRQEPYRKGTSGNYFFVITASGNKEIAAWVAEEAKEKGFLYNSADFPSMGNCHLPARLKKEGLMITVSTDGRSPAFSKYIKEQISRQIPDGYGFWLDRISRVREELKDDLESAETRERFWRKAFDKVTMELVVQGKLDEAEECVRCGISSFRS